MAKLSDVRRRFPPEDADAYATSYADADLAARLGELAHRLRSSSGLSEHDLAARMGVDADDVLRVEEGDAAATLAFLDRLGRALGVRLAVSGGGVEVVFGGVGALPPSDA